MKEYNMPPNPQGPVIHTDMLGYRTSLADYVTQDNQWNLAELMFSRFLELYSVPLWYISPTVVFDLGNTCTHLSTRRKKFHRSSSPSGSVPMMSQ